MRKRGRPASPGLLTPREQEVLDFLRESLTNPEIGDRLGISVETVKQHVSEILSKLGVATREEAAAWQPEPQRRWSFGRSVLAIAGASVVAAAIAGLALLAWGLSRSDEGDDSAAAALSATPTLAGSGAAPSSTQAANSTPNLLLRDFWMADANNGWMGGASRGCKEPGSPCVGVIFHTSNGGDSWDEQYSGDVLVSALAFDGQELGFAIGTTGTCDSRTSACPSGVLRTTDGGLHWNEVTTTPYQLTHLSVTAGDAWAIGEGCPPDQSPCAGNLRLLTSVDGVDTWDTFLLPISAFETDLSRPTANDAWIATSPAGPGSAQIIVTHDAGRTWQNLPMPENGAGFEQRIFFRSANEGWLVVAGQPGAGSQLKEVFSTTDGGQSWTHLTGSLAPEPGGSLPDSGLSIGGYIGPIVFTSEVDGWMASPRAGILHSSDGGTNWSLALMDDNLSAAQFTDPQHGWALSLIALWSTADGGATWRSASPPDTDNR